MSCKKVISLVSIQLVLLAYWGCGLTSTYISDEYKSLTNQPKESEIVTRIFLIGDAGQPAADIREPVLEALEIEASELPEKSLIMYLGDNIYPAGLYDADSELRSISESRLNEQIKVVENSKAAGLFIPGNHDWDQGGEGGWHKIIDQERYIASKKLPQVEMLPKDGCPGPVVFDRGDKLRIIILDTQWWLHENDKPTAENSQCKYADEDIIVKALDDAIKSAGNKFVIVAAHHPLDTYGSHGGFFTWKSHIFPLLSLNNYLWIPLPVIGSIYPLARIWGISNQDISSSAYQNMKNKIESVISKYENVTYVSGHEHSIQVLEGKGDNFYLISGFGTSFHQETIRASDKTVFANAKQGYMQIDVLSNGKVRLGIHQVDKESGNWGEVFAMWLRGNKEENKNENAKK